MTGLFVVFSSLEFYALRLRQYVQKSGNADYKYSVFHWLQLLQVLRPKRSRQFKVLYLFAVLFKELKGCAALIVVRQEYSACVNMNAHHHDTGQFVNKLFANFYIGLFGLHPDYLRL